MTFSDRQSPSDPSTQPALSHEAIPVAGLPSRLEGMLAGIQDRLAARARSSRARALFVAGKVTLSDPLTRSERLISAGDLIATDMTLRVGERGSRVMLRLDDGSELWLGENSELNLSSWSATGSRQIVQLEAGRVLAFVAKSARRFVIQWRRGTQVEAIGTSFDVTATEADIRVDVLSGVVALRNIKGEATGSLGDRLESLAEALPRRRRGSVTSARHWMRETLALTGAANSEDWTSALGGPLEHAYRHVAPQTPWAAIWGWATASRQSLLAGATLFALAGAAWSAHSQGLFQPAPRFSTEEVVAAAFELQQRQVKKYGKAAEAMKREGEVGVVREDAAGKLNWVALNERDLRDIESAGIPDDLKNNLIAGAAGIRERGAAPSGNIIQLGETRIDYANDVLATSDFVKWLSANGVPKAEAKRRAALGLSHSIRERLPEEYRHASIPITFDESKPSE
jgi:hypothetical protein